MIEYEFYYEEGRLEAHPAIGRLAFLITPDGVRGHHVTDGEFERTGLSPENVHLLLSDPGSALSLKPNSWNRVRIILSGDHLQLQLNGGTVATHQLAEGSDRTFGLFHFSDQTQLHVRDISWRGEWPKQLPDVLSNRLYVFAHNNLRIAVALLTELKLICAIICGRVLTTGNGGQDD